MQHNGYGMQHAAVTSRPQKPYNFGDRAVSYGHTNGGPTRPSLTEVAQPSWRSISATQPGHQGTFLTAQATSKPVSPIPFRRNDVVARHLLVETALLDSRTFELLPIEEVDELKKEKYELDARLDATRRKLALESKVRDAAQSLHRLYTSKERPTSPQSPQKQRMSFLGDRRSSSGTHRPKSANQAGDELATSQRKLQDLEKILGGLESRRSYVESRLLRHTAAVLQVAHSEEAEERANGLHLDIPNDMHDSNRAFADHATSDYARSNGYEESIYSNDRGEGFQELLDGRLNGGSHKSQKPSPLSPGQLSVAQSEKMGLLQGRLEVMNSHMRALIKQARSGQPSAADDEDFEDTPSAYPDESDFVQRIAAQVELMDKNMGALERQVTGMKEAQDRLAEDKEDQQHAIEGQLESLNGQVYSLIAESGQEESFEPPPAATGHGAQPHMRYLEGGLLTLEGLLQHSTISQRSAAQETSRQVEEAEAKASEHAQNNYKYEATFIGLWEILTSKDDNKEPFSLPAFSTRVQQMFDRSAFHEDQADILRRQIQQQRELNSKSDVEKERQLSDLQSSHAGVEEELSELRSRHVMAEQETSNVKAEMDNVMRELERFKEVAKTHAEQKQQVIAELEEHRGRNKELMSNVEDRNSQIAELQDDARLAGVEKDGRLQQLTKELQDSQVSLSQKHGETEKLECEVIRLTTELVMAKAELDGAYGSRAERAKEVAMNPEIQEKLGKLDELQESHANMTAELDRLRLDKEATNKTDTRTAMLEKELAEMANDYQGLTRETVEVEKEREQLEALVDGLRDRCEALEGQMNDEKVRWLGIKSPTASVIGDSGREMTSTMVMRNEFKRMMRETRAEASKHLRAEQEVRRKLEAIIRNMRRENMPTKNGLSPRA